MFRRRVANAGRQWGLSQGILASSSFGISSVLRADTLSVLKTAQLSTIRKPFSASTRSFLRGRFERGNRLHFSTQSTQTTSTRSTVPVLIAVTCAGTAAIFITKSSWEKVHAEGEPQTEEEGFFSGLYKKLTGSVSEAFNTANDAPLLPDQDPPPYTKAYTLVISDDALLARSYSLKEGFATKKRPGVEFFLASLAAMDYEIVIFSLQGIQTYGQMIEKLDPNHHAPHRLFLDATVLNSSGKQVKDLSRLNRDLKKVIAIDVDKEAVVPVENLIIIPKYSGKESKDTVLLDMLPFFRLIAHGKHDGDLRTWVKKWHEHGPKHFKETLEEAVRRAREKQDDGRKDPKREEEEVSVRSFWRGGRK